MFEYKAIIDGYTDGAKAYTSTWAEPHPWLSEARALAEQCVSHGRLLDVGCAGGVEAGWWRQRGYTVVGIDASWQMVAIARHREPHLRFEVLNLFDVRELGMRFGIVWCTHVLLHIREADIPNALQALHDVTDPDGALVVSTPISDSNFEDEADVAGLVDVHGRAIRLPRTILTLGRLTSALTDAGFRVRASLKVSPLHGRLEIANIVSQRDR